MTRSVVLHCGWSMSNGITICGADAKRPKVQLAPLDVDISCKRCLNVLILAAEKDISERGAALREKAAEVANLKAQRARL